jgi:hypothetical protein
MQRNACDLPRADTLRSHRSDGTDYRREAGAWKIARRRLQPLYQGAADLSGPLPPA